MLQKEWAQHIYSPQDRCWFMNLIQTVESIIKISPINQITDAVKIIIHVYATQNKWIHQWCNENVSLNLTSAVLGGFLNNKPASFDSIFVAFVAFEPERFQLDWCVNESKREIIPAALLRCSEHHSFMLTTTPFSSSQISPCYLQSIRCCSVVLNANIKCRNIPEFTLQIWTTCCGSSVLILDSWRV